MADDAKKVFVSYRRGASQWFALRLSDALRDGGFDVFIDIGDLGPGEYGRVILTQIEARPHFLVALTTGALDGMEHDDDWLRRELEHALAHNRNIVPITHDGFDLDGANARAILDELPKTVARNAAFQAVNVPADYFDAAVEKIKSRVLTLPTSPPLAVTPATHQPKVEEIQEHAEEAASSLAFRSRFGAVLPAPELTVQSSGFTASALAWTAVPGAAGYVLQRDADDSFAQPLELYRGNGNHLTVATRGLGVTYHYRVKTIAGLRIGRWSNPVMVEQPKVFLSAVVQPHPLPSPILTAKGTSITWSTVADAEGYVVERSMTGDFASSVVAYSGADTGFKDSLFADREDGPSMLRSLSRWHRVRATSPTRADSAWSEVQHAQSGR